jgi:N-acyl-D-amino-acid deacylase
MRAWVALLALFAGGCAPAPQYETVIRHGTVYDGTGAAAIVQDLAIDHGRVMSG